MHNTWNMRRQRRCSSTPSASVVRAWRWGRHSDDDPGKGPPQGQSAEAVPDPAATRPRRAAGQHPSIASAGEAGPAEVELNTSTVGPQVNRQRRSSPSALNPRRPGTGVVPCVSLPPTAMDLCPVLYVPSSITDASRCRVRAALPAGAGGHDALGPCPQGRHY
jgi:hypothetical protein